MLVQYQYYLPLHQESITVWTKFELSEYSHPNYPKCIWIPIIQISIIYLSIAIVHVWNELADEWIELISNPFSNLTWFIEFDRLNLKSIGSNWLSRF